MLHLALLASGSGSNAQAIFDAIQAGKLEATIKIVLCNCSDAGVLERAKSAGIKAVCIEHKNFSRREAFDLAMIECIREAGADTVVLAGFMRLLTPTFIQAFPKRILNIHPALLPAFPGAHGMRDAQDWGVTISGCTVHFVDEIMDHGAVIIQAAVPANPGESQDALAQRIHRYEHRIYPQALQWLSKDRLRQEGRHIQLLSDPQCKSSVLTEPALVWPPLEDDF